jgi:hypothetical protein
MVGQSDGEVGEVVAVPETRDRRSQMLGCRSGISGGQGQATQYLIAPGHVGIPAVPLADVRVADGQRLETGATPCLRSYVVNGGEPGAQREWFFMDSCTVLPLLHCDG